MRWTVLIFVLFPVLCSSQSPFVVGHSQAGNLPARVESNRGLAVNLQDQTTRPFDLYFSQQIGSATTLNAPTVLNDTTIILTSVVDVSVGDYIGLFSGPSLEDHFYFAEVLSVDGDTVEVDSPLDFAFDSLDPVISTTREMDVDGSPTFQTFTVTNGTAATQIEIDITRIVFQILTTAAPNIDEFGDLTTLNRGIVLRRNNGTVENIFNAKSNGDLLNLMFDLNFYNAAGPGPQGSNGLGGRFTFAGQDKHGVAIRLAGGESLDLIIQDDLTDLLLFRMIAAGHIVTE